MSRLFTEEVAERLVGLVSDGLSTADACQQAGVAVETCRHWLKRGRREVDTPYAHFAAEVDRARREAALASMDDDDFVAHINRAVRAGSVSAMRLWWQVRCDLRRESEDDVDHFDEIDRLVQKRADRLAELPGGLRAYDEGGRRER